MQTAKIVEVTLVILLVIVFTFTLCLGEENSDGINSRTDEEPPEKENALERLVQDVISNISM